jgi:hypothetical protein
MIWQKQWEDDEGLGETHTYWRSSSAMLEFLELEQNSIGVMKKDIEKGKTRLASISLVKNKRVHYVSLNPN